MTPTIKMTRKFSEVKMTRWERRYICGGQQDHREAVRAFYRADRKAARLAARDAALEEV